MTAQVHSFIADLIHRHGFMDRDGFALSASRALVGAPKWQRNQIIALLAGVQTDMFGRHRKMPKKAALELIADGLLERWPKMPPTASQNPSTVKLLFLAANPLDPADPTAGPSLALDVEIREITRMIRASDYRDSFKLASRWAVMTDDLIQALNEEQPLIVHFSGHGSSAHELFLLDRDRMPKTVSKAALSGLFGAMKDNIRLVVLNACFSKGQAASITKHIDCAIGMTKKIGDEAAITFAASFYRAIGFGRSVKEAFGQGISALQLEGIDEDRTPRLLARRGINPNLVKLIVS